MVFCLRPQETDATRDSLEKLYKAYGNPKDIIFITVEHRGYGQRVTSSTDQSQPSYITIEQALADYHRFVQEFKVQYSGPWMAVGYNYGGSLAVNFAHRYPEDIKGILASRVVVDWPVFFPIYDRSGSLWVNPSINAWPGTSAVFCRKECLIRHGLNGNF